VEEGRKRECGQGWEELVPTSPPIAASASCERRKRGSSIGKADSRSMTTTWNGFAYYPVALDNLSLFLINATLKSYNDAFCFVSSPS